MNNIIKSIIVTTLLLVPVAALSQDSKVDDGDSLKIAALEALMSAPADKALPLVNKVLNGNHSVEVKERALFILSQNDSPEAQATLLTYARDASVCNSLGPTRRHNSFACGWFASICSIFDPS